MITLTNKYKDATPFQTLNRIRECLEAVGVTIFEQSWDHISSRCFSVRIEIDQFPGVGTNGKGTTRSFALASAYGELMERLQNKKLFSKNYGLKFQGNTFPDEKPGDLLAFRKENRRLLAELVTDSEEPVFEQLVRKYPRLSLFSSFYDVFAGQTVLLPSVLIATACGTNGMCAGNTPGEAISHGICEVIERYVSKRILADRLVLPTIGWEEVEEGNLKEIIGLLKESGIEVYVKDCTLGGKYPVVGVLLLDRRRSRYQLRLGSDAIFSIALERCLTEVTQGRDIRSLLDSMLPIPFDAGNDPERVTKNLAAISKNGSGQFPDSIFVEKTSDGAYRNAFLSEMRNNRQGYDHLLRILKEDGHRVFIRDLSFLSFPAYKIYIPGLSEIFSTDCRRIENQASTSQVGKSLLNLWKCSRQEMEFLVEKLAGYCTTAGVANFQLGESPYFKSMNLHLARPNPLEKMDIRLVVSLVGYIIGKDQLAADFFASFVGSLGDGNYRNLDYYRCISAFLRYKAEGIEKEETILKKLQTVFPGNVAREVVADFRERSTGLLVHQPLPSCPDCGHCKLDRFCLWEEWDQKKRSMDERADRFDFFMQTDPVTFQRSSSRDSPVE